MAQGHESPGRASYAQWVRRVIARVRSDRQLLVSLFESSVPEPTGLMRELLLEGFGEPITSRYTSAFSDGNPFVVQHLADRYGLTSEHILCTTGATGALSLLYRALVKPGERVLIENPCFDVFHTLAHAHGLGVDRFERRGEGFTIDPDEVAAAIGPKTRVVVLSNLHNPSGMPVSTETLTAIGRIAEARGFTVIVDEVYGRYADVETRPGPAAHLSPSIISVNSLTKIFGLSTLRCGWIVGDPSVMRTVRALHDEVEFGISNLAHAMAALVLERSDRFLRYSNEVLQKARPIIDAYHAHWVDRGLVSGALPAAGCVAFPRLVGIDDTIAFSEWLADRGGVVVAPGEYFGRAGHIRLGFGIAPGKLDYGLQALTDGLTSWHELPPARREVPAAAK